MEYFELFSIEQTSYLLCGLVSCAFISVKYIHFILQKPSLAPNERIPREKQRVKFWQWIMEVISFVHFRNLSLTCFPSSLHTRTSRGSRIRPSVKSLNAEQQELTLITTQRSLTNSFPGVDPVHAFAFPHSI